MSAAIRLSRAGRVHLPYYHISVYDSRTRRDGRPVERIGLYDPESAKEQVRLDVDRAKYWLSVGARPSTTVATLFKQKGLTMPAPTTKAAPAAGKKTPAKKKAARTAKPKTGQATAKKARKPRTANSKARGEKARKAKAG